MPICLDLEPELEQRLRAIAEARGLTAEGYLLALIEALTDPPPQEQPKRLRGVLHRLLPGKKQSHEPGAIADDAIRRMKEELLLHKEHTVAAVTKANLLQKTAEKLQAAIAEKELQAVTLERDGDPQALCRFQESCVYGQNLQFTKAQLDIASAEAEELLAAFRQEERRVKKRLSPTQAGALEAIDNEFTRIYLTAEEMERRIFAMGNAEQWQERFDIWIEPIVGPTQPEVDASPPPGN